VAGIGTGVGKTIVSAIMTTMLEGSYWKPFQTGLEHSDAQEIARLTDSSVHQIFPPAYSLQAPLSPHHAARLENIDMELTQIFPPPSSKPLVIEAVGGVYVPLSSNTLSIELFHSWEANWIVVSKHYLGSINHTLLTIEALKVWKIPILGIVFNGMPNPDTEDVILTTTKVPYFGRLLPEPHINKSVIRRYAKQWKQ
jgi:dethiobiotin synthetase